jgi:hypothetical protein
LDIAASTGLQVTAVRRSIDRCNVEEDELAGFRQRPTQLIARAHQPALLIPPRSVYFALKAGIDQFEVEHCDFGRIGACRRRGQQHQRDDETGNSHDRGP